MIDLNKIETFSEAGFEVTTELDIVRLLIKSSVFAATYAEHLSTNLFRDQLKPIIEAATGYWKQYSKLPSNEALVQELKWKIGANFTPEKAASVIDVLKEVGKSPSDPEYIEDSVKSFLKFQRVKVGIGKSIDLLHQAHKEKNPAKLDEIAKIIERSLESLTVERPSWFLADLDYRTERRADEANGSLDNLIVFPTGIKPLDKIYGKGGLLAGELGIVIAPTGRGKSVFLEQVANAAAAFGIPSIYFSLELSEQLLLDRMDSMVSEVELRQIVEERNEVRERILEKWQSAPNGWGEIMFRELSALGTSTFTLKNEIHRAQRLYNFYPQLIVVDYLDLLTPAQRGKDQDWKNQALCAKELRDLGRELGCASWTASQANRIGRNKQEEGTMITDGDSAESYAKTSVADFIISLNQKKKYFELPDGQPKPMIIHVPKNRNGKANINIGILTDFKKMAFYVGDYDEQEQLEQDALNSPAFSDGNENKKKGKKKLNG